MHSSFSRVIDEKNPGKHFTRKEMGDYFTLPPSHPVSMLDEKSFYEEDPVLDSVLRRHRDVIIDVGTQASLWREDVEELTPTEIATAQRLAEAEADRDVGEEETSGDQLFVPTVVHTDLPPVAPEPDVTMQ
jgi:hypothetical protein